MTSTLVIRCGILLSILNGLSADLKEGMNTFDLDISQLFTRPSQASVTGLNEGESEWHQSWEGYKRGSLSSSLLCFRRYHFR